MRRVLTFIALAITSLIITAWGEIQQHPAVMYAGIIIGGFIGLAIVVFIIKWLWRLIGKSLTSTLFLLLSGAIIYTLAWHEILSPVISLVLGVSVGFMLLLVLIRSLGKYAQTSMIFGEIFSFFTGYQLKSYLTRESIMSAEEREVERNDYKNIQVILVQNLGFDKKEAKEAAAYVIENTPLEASIEDKIQTALKYCGRNN